MTINTSKGAFIIREAVPADLDQLVHIHVTSFNLTYADYFPKPTYELRKHQWANLFQQRPAEWFCFVAEAADGTIAGFASAHNFEDPFPRFEGQLDKIHFLPDYQRLGLGKVLVKEVVRKFITKGFSSMILFADPANPAIHFYDLLGGQRLIDEHGNFNGAFGWRNLEEILEK